MFQKVKNVADKFINKANDQYKKGKKKYIYSYRSIYKRC